jgi:hypothetical protein
MTKKPKELPIAKTNSSEGKKLADLAAIIQDFRAIMQTCSRIKNLLDENSKDHILLESLWVSALIKYARCFATGKRFGLSKDIYQNLQGEPLKAHQFYIDLRNKHIAHSVNPFEQMEVGFVLSSVDEPDKRIVGIATLAIRHIVSDKKGVQQLGMLSKIAHDKICSMAKETEQKVLEEGKKILIDDLYKIARPRLVAPGPDLANKSRT